jgi:hypothetical protein
MVHGYGADAKWFATLTEIDEVFAQRVRDAGCSDCGGPLDRADYERKPRGDLGEAAEVYRRRRSFCCRREGCRHRATPPSVRFLGRKVYVAALVVIASVLGRQQVLVGHGSRRRVEGVPVRTVRRWLEWWSITFVLTAFWNEAKAFLASPVEEAMLPGSLLACFGVTTEAATLTRMLRWIAPITTASCRAEIAMPV